MHLRRQPADARAERRPAQDVRGKVFTGRTPQHGHAVLAGPENVWSAERSTPGSDAGSHGAVDPQDGPLFGSFVASGIKATTPAATTDAASPQRTLYGACPRADGPVTAMRTRPTAKRRIQDSDQSGALQLTCARAGALTRRIARGLRGLGL